MTEFQTLGRAGGVFTGLERFPLQHALDRIVMESDEVTALCPVTGQPDQYTITITVTPGKWGLESKTLKLYLQQIRNRGAFCETLAGEIARDIGKVIEAETTVTIRQKPRGGVGIVATATWRHDV